MLVITGRTIQLFTALWKSCFFFFFFWSSALMDYKIISVNHWSHIVGILCLKWNGQGAGCVWAVSHAPSPTKRHLLEGNSFRCDVRARLGVKLSLWAVAHDISVTSVHAPWWSSARFISTLQEGGGAQRMLLHPNSRDPRPGCVYHELFPPHSRPRMWAGWILTDNPYVFG